MKTLEDDERAGGSGPASIVARALLPSNLYSAYQPIVDLETRGTVGWEALARWRDPDLSPGVVFGAAAAAGRLPELDWACRIAALEGALDLGMDEGQTLFVNVEPAAFGSTMPEVAGAILRRATTELRIVVELTERALLRDPRQVLRIVRRARDMGCGVALDDIGAEPDSLTLLPFVEPDVIKLDMSLVQRQSGDHGRIMAAVLAHAEASGATILAEGVETAAHLGRARALGATLGQGWLFAPAGPLTRGGGSTVPIPLTTGSPTPPTPFALVARSERLRVGPKSVLVGISHHIESLGNKDSDLVILGAFQTAAHFTAATAHRFAHLARRSPLVGALGAGLGAEPARGVRGASLGSDDALIGEWVVIAVGPHYAGALIAKERHESQGQSDATFDFVVTHDRPIVLDAARSLVERLLPSSDG